MSLLQNENLKRINLNAQLSVSSYSRCKDTDFSIIIPYHALCMSRDLHPLHKT